MGCVGSQRTAKKMVGQDAGSCPTSAVSKLRETNPRRFLRCPRLPLRVRQRATNTPITTRSRIYSPPLRRCRQFFLTDGSFLKTAYLR